VKRLRYSFHKYWVFVLNGDFGLVNLDLLDEGFEECLLLRQCRFFQCYPGADPATRLVPVELLLPKLPRPIAEGSFARIAINQGQQRGILVPQAAVVPQAGGKAAVFLVTPAMTAERRPVTTGLEADGKVLIVAGLEEGAKIVVQGQDALKDGQPVNVMPGKPGLKPANVGPGQQQPGNGMPPMRTDSMPARGTAKQGGNTR
jgi:hypothetical protein